MKRDLANHDAIEKVLILVSAASRAEDISLRALYVAEARTFLEAEAARLDGARRLVAAEEKELERVARTTA